MYSLTHVKKHFNPNEMKIHEFIFFALKEVHQKHYSNWDI